MLFVTAAYRLRVIEREADFLLPEFQGSRRVVGRKADIQSRFCQPHATLVQTLMSTIK
jgi:hypothetical protein